VSSGKGKERGGGKSASLRGGGMRKEPCSPPKLIEAMKESRAYERGETVCMDQRADLREVKEYFFLNPV